MKHHYMNRLTGDLEVFLGVTKSTEVSITKKYKMTLGSLEVLHNEELWFYMDIYFTWVFPSIAGP